MHQLGIAHRDLKPDNILVNPKKEEIENFKIIDLGVSKKFLQHKQRKQVEMWTSTGSPFYCAPEIFQGFGYTQRIDIWAVGVIMFQCLTNKLPFQEDSISDTIEAICKGKIDYDQYPFSNLAKDLLKRLLQVDPKKRLKARNALKHIFLTTEEEIKLRVQNQEKCHDDILVHDGFDISSQVLFTCLANSQNPAQQINSNIPYPRKFSGQADLNKDCFQDIHLTAQEHDFSILKKLQLRKDICQFEQ